MRPPSIVQFERVYVCSIVLGLIAALSWLLAPPVIAFPADAPAGLAQMTRIVSVVAMIGGIAINLLLLYFIARRGSDVARWIFVVLFAMGLAGVARQFGPHIPVLLSPVARVLGIVQLVLQAACVWLMFRPDAKAWFRR